MKLSLALFALALGFAQQPADPAAQADAHMAAGRWPEAIALLKPLAAANPNDYVTHFNLAVSYSFAGRDDDAIPIFEHVLGLKPELTQARTNLAQVLINTRRFARASEILAPAFEQNPSNARIASLAGLAASAAADWPRARTTLERAVELEPADRESWLRLADAEEHLNEPAKAAAIYARFPADAAAQERRALLLLQSGDNEAAIDVLERVRQTAPTTANLYALATAYLRTRQPLKALPVALQALEREPANFDIRMFAGRILRDQKRYTEAGPHFLAAVRAKPDNGEAWNELTAILILLKQYEQGIGALEKAKQLNGETPAYHYFRAILLDAMNAAEPALESYRRFLAITGDQHPDEAWKARQRIKVLEKAVKR